jgi:hypothetical protein
MQSASQIVDWLDDRRINRLYDQIQVTSVISDSDIQCDLSWNYFIWHL